MSGIIVQRSYMGSKKEGGLFGRWDNRRTGMDAHPSSLTSKLMENG